MGNEFESDQFEALDACHRDITRHLNALGALAKHIETDGIDDKARQQAATIEAFFSGTSRQHPTVVTRPAACARAASSSPPSCTNRRAASTPIRSASLRVPGAAAGRRRTATPERTGPVRCKSVSPWREKPGCGARLRDSGDPATRAAAVGCGRMVAGLKEAARRQGITRRRRHGETLFGWAISAQ